MVHVVDNHLPTHGRNHHKLKNNKRSNKIFIQTKSEGKVKSSQPSLCETQDKQLLGRDLDRSWCHHHTTSMIKLFMVTAHGSISAKEQEILV